MGQNYPLFLLSTTCSPSLSYLASSWNVLDHAQQASRVSCFKVVALTTKVKIDTVSVLPLSLQ